MTTLNQDITKCTIQGIIRHHTRQNKMEGNPKKEKIYNALVFMVGIRALEYRLNTSIKEF